MPKGVRFKYVRPKEFESIKLLIKGGLSNKQIGDALTRSPVTIGKVRVAEDFADYQRRNLEVSRKYNQPAVQAELPQKESKEQPRLLSTGAEEALALMRSIDTSLKFICDNMVVRHKRKMFGSHDGSK